VEYKGREEEDMVQDGTSLGGAVQESFNTVLDIAADAKPAKGA